MRYFRVLAILLSMMVATSFAAKASSGKVRSRIGDASLQKEGKSNWTEIKVGNKVHQGDNIRTLVESQVIIALPDGSTISIEENSLVTMAEIMSEDGVNRMTAEIKQGKMRFDAQKQGKDSFIKFKTGTAVAAIRGTEGIIGMAGKETYAALISGLFELANGNQQVSINAGQLAFTLQGMFTVLNVDNAGEASFMKLVEQILSGDEVPLDSIISAIKSADSLVTETIKSIKDSIKCEFTTLPDTVFENTVEIKGQCPNGITVKIGAEKFTSEGKELKFTPNWLNSEYGEKKFPITCYIGNISMNCGQLNMYYARAHAAEPAQPEFVLKTPSTVDICNPAKVDIEGSFNPNDPGATLLVKFARQTTPINIANNSDGQFLHSITINDAQNNWNEKNIVVEYTPSNGKTISNTINLNVNKSCKQVNTQKPSIQLGDQSRCKVSISVAENKGDTAILSILENASSKSQMLIDGNSNVNFNLSEGEQDYKFIVEDLAGNKSEVSKTMGCFSTTNATLKITGTGGSTERLRVPPTPPQSKVQSFHKMITFSIDNLPSKNPAYIKSITISQNGKKISNFSPSDFRSVVYDQQIELYRNKKTTVNIEVVLKSGEILKASQTYEVH